MSQTKTILIVEERMVERHTCFENPPGRKFVTPPRPQRPRCLFSDAHYCQI